MTEPIGARERTLSAPMMQRAASVRPESYREDDNSIELVWSTGAAGLRFDWWDGEFYIEELSMDAKAVRLDRLNAGAPLLDTHADYSCENVLGSVVPGTASIEGGNGVARVRLAKTPDVADINAKIIDGHIRNVSVGYQVHTYQRTETEGEKPHLLATDWEPVELSMVPVPFDAGAQVRARSATQGGQHPCTIRGIPAKETTMPDTVIEPAADPVPAPAVTETAVVEVREIGPKAISASQITARAKPLGADFALELIERHGKSPMTELDLERAINDKYAEANPLPEIDNSITVQRDANDKFVEGAMHGILARAGLSRMVEDAAKARGDTLRIDPGEFRGVRLASLAAESLARAGVKLNTRNEQDVVEAALQHVRQVRSAGVITQTTSDFGTILETTMNKVVQAAYAVQPDTWRMFCKVGSVTDFRDQNRYLLGSFGALDTLGEAGEIKNKPIPDGAREKIRASTKANIINLSRNAIVNDDLGAFSELATALGRAAKLSIEVDVYALLNANPTMADGYALFSSQHGNLAGSGAAPSVAAFDAARVAMASQKDVSGNDFLDIRPAVWLGPIGIGGQAKVVNGSQYDPDTANKLQRPNIALGIFKDIVDTPRLTGTAWYVFADPETNPTLEVVFLNGEEEPKVDSQDGWRSLGVEWRVIHDYGVGAINYRSAQKNPGA